MVEDIRRGLRERWPGYGAALGAVGAVSLLIGAIMSYRAIGNLPVLYLLAVLMAAIRYGRGPPSPPRSPLSPPSTGSLSCPIIAS